MDPISQGIVGVVAAQAGAKVEKIKAATFADLIGGMTADLDIFFKSDSDPLMILEYHRHFTHSLFFIPIGGLLTALVLWWFFKKFLTFKQLATYTTLGYATAGLLDACTSYGTRLLWPFSDMRVAWNIIGIIDPVFTFTLIGLCVFAFYRRSRKLVYAAVIFIAGYLSLGTLQHFRALGEIKAIAEARSHSGERFNAYPTPMNIILFRTLYEYDGRYYADAIRVGLTGEVKHYEGESIPVYKPEDVKPRPAEDSVLAKDIQRFEHFADSYLSWHPKDQSALTDMRYALLPHSVYSMWGIEVNPARPSEHTPRVQFRRLTDNTWETFENMLMGKDIP